MNTFNRTIDCKVGIYDSKYILTIHRDGSATVRVPGIKWVDNSGTLYFRCINISKSLTPKIKQFFIEDEFGNAAGETLNDCLYAAIGGY